MNDGLFKSMDCHHSPNIRLHNMSQFEYARYNCHII